METNHTHGKPEFIPEDINIDYSNEIVFRYLRYEEYPAGCDWWNYNPLIEVEDDPTIS